MKIVKRVSTRSSKPATGEVPTTETAERIKALMPLALEQWYDEHNKHKGSTITWAYLGLQWDSCPYYHWTKCVCGSVSYIKKQGSEVIIIQEDPITDVRTGTLETRSHIHRTLGSSCDEW